MKSATNILFCMIKYLSKYSSMFSVSEVGSIQVITSTIDDEKKEAERYIKQLTDKMHEHHVRFYNLKFLLTFMHFPGF